MSLLTRLVSPLPGEEKIPVHQFMAAIAEFQRGAPGVNAKSVGDGFNLSQPERDSLATFYQQQILTGNVNRALLHDVLMLGEGGIYTLQQVANRLGL